MTTPEHPETSQEPTLLKKGTKKAKKIIASVLSLAGVFALWLGFRFAYSYFVDPLKVGKCFSIKGISHEPEKSSCETKDKVTYTLISEFKNIDECPEPYDRFERDKSRFRPAKSYCAMPNLIEKACYKGGPTDMLEKTECGKDSFVVTKRIDNVSDEGQCKAPAEAIVFSKDPKRTYCVTFPTEK